MFDTYGTYQHFKQLVNWRIYCREGRMSMLWRDLHLVMQFRAGINHYLSIDNTLNLIHVFYLASVVSKVK